jgi:Asp-tRNA(Asn)/Glu-tRNA(Gln) amidotransferase A subunit family amidase
MPSNLLSIAEASQQIHRGTLRPLGLLEQCLRRIGRYDDRLRAWVVVDEAGARQAARSLGDEAAAGKFRGPLHGIPLGIKDLVDVAGLPTRAGSPLREQHLAQHDAPLVAALRAAGAVIVGKTVTVEFAAFDPPPTRNPWDPALRRTPGGSSSGSAVAVAMGMCLGAIGTQTGGSLVRPASYCGVATCKPSFGRISTEGIVPLSPHLDHPGPMARHVADLTILLHAMLGTDGVELPRLSGPPQLGVVENFFMERADGPIRTATRTALDRLAAAGAHVVPLRLPIAFEEVLAMHYCIMAFEAAAYHRAAFAEHRSSYGPMITTLLDAGLAISPQEYAAALADQRHVSHQIENLLGSFDALIAPSTDTTAPGLDTTGPRDFQAPWSYAGAPVVSIPCGLASDRMPAAVQLVGRHGQEAPLLATAEWCEEVLAFDALPPLLSQEI